MKKFPLILGILIFLDILYFSFVNSKGTLSFTYPPILKSIVLSAGIGYLFLGVYSALGAFLISYYYIKQLQDRLKKQTRKIEKASIESQEVSDKVKALQSKVNTLEVALKEALSRK